MQKALEPCSFFEKAYNITTLAFMIWWQITDQRKWISTSIILLHICIFHLTWPLVCLIPHSQHFTSSWIWQCIPFYRVAYHDMEKTFWRILPTWENWLMPIILFFKWIWKVIRIIRLRILLQKVLEMVYREFKLRKGNLFEPI